MNGQELSHAFYLQKVRPLLGGRPHAAGLLGPGSEVLGYDDEMSTDHDWGPRVQLFVEGEAPALEVSGGSLSVQTPADFFRSYLGLEVRSARDWLAVPQCRLATIAAGPVWHDDLGLETLRRELVWYPHDLWLYLMAAGWMRIGQEDHLMARAGFAGDELGSSVIAARLVRDLMRLAFLLERRYAPYPKWFGRAFEELRCAGELSPLLFRVLRSSDWKERTDSLSRASEAVARMHAHLELAPVQPLTSAPFFDRPFPVIGGERFTRALLAEIRDPEVSSLPFLGSVDQWCDSTELLAHPERVPSILSVYGIIKT